MEADEDFAEQGGLKIKGQAEAQKRRSKWEENADPSDTPEVRTI